MTIYPRPMIYYFDGTSYITLRFPDKTAYQFSIEEQAKAIYNETLDGNLEMDYLGDIYIIKFQITGINEFSNDWFNWYSFIDLIRKGTLFDFYPAFEPPSGYNRPFNYHKAYLSCVIKNPKHENARYENISGRWSVYVEAQTGTGNYID